MAIFIVLWPYLLTTKLKSVIRHNLGHSNRATKRVKTSLDLTKYTLTTLSSAVELLISLLVQHLKRQVLIGPFHNNHPLH